MSDLERKYLTMFGELPTLMMTMSYEDDIYQILMKEALENREPITDDKLNRYIERYNIKYDVDSE